MPESILIIGKSKVGLSLAKAITTSKSYRLAGVIPARAKSYPILNSDIIIIATKDDKISEVARKAILRSKKRPTLIIHVAGSLPASILPQLLGVMRLTLHPLQTFPKPDHALFAGIYWMASSEDARSIAWARKFVAKLGSRSLFVLPADALPLYHAMTVFSSNLITLLFAAIEEISSELGQNPKKMKAALRPLAERSLQNALAKPALSVLSGPISRNDLSTIKKHQKALNRLDPKIAKIYDAFVKFAR